MTAVEAGGLRVELTGAGTPVVDGISFEVARGEILAVVGDSGAGKTTIGQALLGYARRGMRIAGGQVRIEGIDLLGLPHAELLQARRQLIAYVPQDPAAALNPALRIRTQLAEALRGCERAPGRAERIARIGRALEEVDLPAGHEFLARFPHQLSGGQQQRVCLAAALLGGPGVVVLDEPTTGLDAATQAAVLATIRDLCTRRRLAAICITHDLAAVSSVAERTLVVHRGRAVELGPTARVLAAPGHPYTRRLLLSAQQLGRSAVPRTQATRTDTRRGPEPILEIHGVRAYFGATRVLSDVSLEVGAGECVALVGRSGAGKTTLARCAIGLHPRWDGAIVLDGSPLAVGVRDRPVAQRSALQYVFQNPYRSLNPRRTVAESVGMPLRRLFGLGRAELRARVELMLEEVTLPRALASRYPAELSGGERQLVAIVRALACEPCVLICDEVTSSLDRSSEATVVAALERLQSERRLSILFISHDIALARALAHRVAVILQGRIVEEGPAAEVFAAPRHVHTRELVATTHDLATAERGVATAVS